MDDDQSMEVEALKAIYGEDFHELESNAYKNFEIHLVPFPGEEEKNFVGITLEMKFPPDYPSVLPTFTLKDPVEIDEEQISWLESKLAQVAEESLGTQMTFNLASTLKEWLDDNNFSKRELEKQKRLKQEEEREARRRLGTALTRDNFHTWAERFYGRREEEERKLNADKLKRLTGRQLFEAKPEMMTSDASFTEEDEGESVAVDWSLFKDDLEEELPEDD
eukprot:TRINITY_DN19296_c0_g1_i1.p1 TRINITY_DN19296_c0_g1~~TRINITY_DN19296_c0_g1_i1.p1  ORF type:complete len:221 (-),score=58.03 TRINITY_DN19296_c0_g1_i1:122-784(-)